MQNLGLDGFSKLCFDRPVVMDMLPPSNSPRSRTNIIESDQTSAPFLTRGLILGDICRF